MTRFVVVGDLMTDVTAVTAGPLRHASDTPARITSQPGGSAANTAAWLAAAGHETVLAGSIGADAAGRALAASLAATGVTLALDEQPDLPTGTCIVLVDADGERTMLPDRGANARLGDAAVAWLGPGSHLHVSGYAVLGDTTREAAGRLLRAARERGATTSIDCASAAPLDARLDAFRVAAAGTDLLVANADEAAVLGGPRAMLELAACAVVKRGPLGAEGWERGRPGPVAVPAAPVAVVDTTGAGDAFASGFLPSWHAGTGLLAALEAGTLAAARAVGRVGAGPVPPGP